MLPPRAVVIEVFVLNLRIMRTRYYFFPELLFYFLAFLFFPPERGMLSVPDFFLALREISLFRKIFLGFFFNVKGKSGGNIHSIIIRP